MVGLPILEVNKQWGHSSYGTNNQEMLASLKKMYSKRVLYDWGS